MRLRPRSVRVRLALTFAGALAVLLTAFSAGVIVFVRAHLLREVEERARQNLALVERTLAEDPEEKAEIEESGLVALYCVMRDGEPLHISPVWTHLGLPVSAQGPSSPSVQHWKSRDGHVFALATSTAEVRGESFSISVAEDEGPARRSLATLAGILVVGLPLAIALAFVGGSMLAARLLAPVSAMAEAAGRITEERLSERLPVEEPTDEFGRLALVFNRTLGRLEDAFERMRRFTSDASHELRTPLTALRSVGELALRDHSGPEQCRETIASMLEESDRLTRLVEGLLLLTREDSDAYRARFARFDLGELAREVVDVLRILAEDRGQQIETDVESGILVLGDRTTLRQAVLNLVDNAIKYTPQGGTVRVRARLLGKSEAALEVADTGGGIALEHRQRIFERFYRIDRDRSRSTGGAGLGLPIARWAVGLHGGRIELETEEGEGSTFRIRLPRARTREAEILRAR